MLLYNNDNHYQVINLNKELVMKKKIYIGFLLLSLSLAACTQAEDIKPSETGVKQDSNSEDNNTQSLDENISDKRIIAASKTVAEYLALFDQKIVGIAKQENLPEIYAQVEQVGSPRKLNLELISSLNPDYVIANESSKDNLEESLISQNIKSIYLDSSSYDLVFENIKTIGHLLGQDKKADSIIKEMKDKETSIIDKAKDLEGKSLLLIFGNGDNFQLMTQNTYLGNLAEKLGLKNIGKDNAKDKKYLPYSLEEIVKSNPDYILTLAHGNKEQAESLFEKEFEKDIWKNLNAVKENRLIHLDDQTFPVTGNIHVMETLENLLKILKK